MVKNGVVQDWADFVALLRHLFFVEMKLTPARLAEHPVMLLEPPLNPKANRERLLQCVFDNFPVPAVFVANTATLGLYATGTVTGVLVECGYDVSLSVAIYEGEVLPGSLRRLDVAGRDLDQYLSRCGYARRREERVLALAAWRGVARPWGNLGNFFRSHPLRGPGAARLLPAPFSAASLLNLRGYRFNELNALDSFVIRDIKESLCRVAPAKDRQVRPLWGALKTHNWVPSLLTPAGLLVVFAA